MSVGFTTRPPSMPLVSEFMASPCVDLPGVFHSYYQCWAINRDNPDFMTLSSTSVRPRAVAERLARPDALDELGRSRHYPNWERETLPVGYRVVGGQREAVDLQIVLEQLYQNIVSLDEAKTIAANSFDRSDSVELANEIKRLVSLLREQGITVTIPVDIDETTADAWLKAQLIFIDFVERAIFQEMIRVIGEDFEGMTGFRYDLMRNNREAYAAYVEEHPEVEEAGDSFWEFWPAVLDLSNELTGATKRVIITDRDRATRLRQLGTLSRLLVFLSNGLDEEADIVARSPEMARSAGQFTQSRFFEREVINPAERAGIKFYRHLMARHYSEVEEFNAATRLESLGIVRCPENQWIYELVEAYHKDNFYPGPARLNFPPLKAGIELVKLWQFLGIHTPFVTTRSENSDLLKEGPHAGRFATAVWLEGQGILESDEAVLLKPGGEADWSTDAIKEGRVNEPAKPGMLRGYQERNPGIRIVGIMDDAINQVIYFLDAFGSILVICIEGSSHLTEETLPEGSNVISVHRVETEQEARELVARLQGFN